MKLAYLYNEKLPKKTAHDVYVWRNSYFLSHFLKEKTLEVSLLTGLSCNHQSIESLQNYYLPSSYHKEQSQPATKKTLPFWSTFADRGHSLLHEMDHFQWIELPLMRKSGPFRISWNTPFFYRCQKWIEAQRPDWVLMSVYKQADFHLKRKVPGIRYLFEVHDLAFYPEFEKKLPPKEKEAEFERQIRVLNSCNAISVTTDALKKTLEKAPYSIQTPIYVIPLASEMNPVLPQKNQANEVSLGYVGQLYLDQGVDNLIKASAHVPGVKLEIMGGNTRDLERLKNLVKELHMHSRVHFHGFVSPQALHSKIHTCQGLVAPFHPTPHMRQVAHTKLVDYGRWALPVIAPELPITKEETRSSHFFFDSQNYPNSLESLIQTLKLACDPIERMKAQEEIDRDVEKNPDRFSWKERIFKLEQIFKSQ
jgi:glycosyltransferase involved in cell wall biosynthesis